MELSEGEKVGRRTDRNYKEKRVRQTEKGRLADGELETEAVI